MKNTEQAKQLFIEQLAKTPIVLVCCEKLDVSRASFYRWKADDPVFAAKVEESLSNGRLLVNDLAESQLITAIKNGNIMSIMYWLRHNHKTYKNKIELEGSVRVIEELSDEDKEDFSKKLKQMGINLRSYDKRPESD
jgi:hypothetical protein